MSQKRDYYEILGVGRDADPDTIKKSYRKLAMQFHPDRNPGDQAAEDKFKEAAEAYDVLSSPEKKSRYDQFGHQAFGGGGFSQSRGGGARSKNSPRRGSDLRYISEIKLVDVLKDFEKQIEFLTDIECGDCSGLGAEKGSKPVTCNVCKGRGQVVRQQGFFTMATTCGTCKG